MIKQGAQNSTIFSNREKHRVFITASYSSLVKTNEWESAEFNKRMWNIYSQRDLEAQHEALKSQAKMHSFVSYLISIAFHGNASRVRVFVCCLHPEFVRFRVLRVFYRQQCTDIPTSIVILWLTSKRTFNLKNCSPPGRRKKTGLRTIMETRHRRNEGDIRKKDAASSGVSPAFGCFYDSLLRGKGETAALDISLLSPFLLSAIPPAEKYDTINRANSIFPDAPLDPLCFIRFTRRSVCLYIREESFANKSWREKTQRGSCERNDLGFFLSQALLLSFQLAFKSSMLIRKITRKKEKFEMERIPGHLGH